MDWRSLVDERQRRASQNVGAAVPRAFYNIDQDQTRDDEDDGGGFFGRLTNPLSTIGKVAEGVGSFFGDVVNDVVKTTKEGVGTAIDVVQSPGKTIKANKINEEITRRNQEWSKKTRNWSAEDFEKNKEEATRHFAETKKLSEEAQNILSSDGINDRDATKSAAATAETFLNVATLGTGTAVKQVAKASGKEALKKIGKTAGEGALFGAGYGALAPLKNEGSEATTEELWRSALLGTATGGAVGGGLSFLDRGVRQGAREIPGTITNAARQKVDDIRALPQEVKQGGYVRLPGDDAVVNNTNNRPKAELQKAFEDARNSGDSARAAEIAKELDDPGLSAAPLDAGTRARLLEQMKGDQPISVDAARAGTPETPSWAPENVYRDLTPEQQADDQFVQDVASEYQSADDYLEQATKAARAYDDSVRGGITTRGDEGQLVRTSEHSPWYRQYYEQNGRAPSVAATREAVREGLETGQGVPGLIEPREAQVYQLLKERDGSLDAMVNDPAGGQFADFQTMLEGGAPTGQAAPVTSRGSRMPGGLPRGPQGTAPLPGMAPEAGNMQPIFDDPQSLQTALGRMESNNNPMVDYIDPRARVAAPEAPGAQQAFPTENPYAGAEPDLSLPALPAGELPQPMTVAEARRRFRETGETPEFLNVSRSSKNPIELPANTEDMSNIAVRQTKAGKTVPVATNNAHVSKDLVDAIRAIGQDDTGSAFTSMRTPDMNWEEALRKRGGTQSKEFQVIQNEFQQPLRQHTAEYTKFVDNKRALITRIMDEYKLGGKAAQSPSMRAYLESPDVKVDAETLAAFRNEFGEKSAEGLRRLRDFWRQDNKVIRAETNEVLGKYAGKDRLIGDLGDTYLPRVYKSGVKGFKDAALDIKHGGMDKLKSMMNLENPNGYLSKETEVAGTAIRSVDQAPLNSNLAKPNTTYLSAAQKRTANAPIKDMEDPLTSMMRWYESVGKARFLTEDIARGRTIQKAIEGVNGETGNLRQMYDAINDQINAVAGKTSKFDEKLVNTETGNKFVSVATKLQSRIARSTILGSTTSALAQTGQLPLIVAETGANNFRKGMTDMVKHIRSRGEGPIGQSSLMRTRYPNYEDIFATKARTKASNKATDVVAKPFRLIERSASEAAWYSSYAKATGEMGLKGKAAIQEADRITAKIVGERSPGARAALYESKALGPVTSYTLEVNQLYQTAKQYFKRDPKKAAKLVGAIWIYNQGYEAITGNKLNADPLAAGLDAAGVLTNDELYDDEGNPVGMGERILRAGGRLAGETVDATPLGGQIAGTLYPENGIRVPFGGGERMFAKADIFGGTNFGRYDSGPPVAAGLSNPLLLLGIPGMNQLQRSVEGNRAYNEGGAFARDGDAKFLIDQNDENYWRTLLWGIYNTPEGQQYLRDQQARLTGSTT